MSVPDPNDLHSATTNSERSGTDSFSTPADFDHGFEFSTEAPRVLPAFVRHGRYLRSRQATVWTLVMIGSACWATAPLPFVKTLSWYLLPLGYLNWVGCAFLVLAAIYQIRNLMTLGYLDYLRRGEPLIGRVNQAWLDRVGAGEVPMGRFAAEVQFLHPDSLELQKAVVSSPDIFPLAGAEKMESGVAQGNFVTLVYLPGRLDQSLQLYGWLALNPDLDLIRKNGKPLKPLSPFFALMLVIAGTALGWALLGFIYVIGRYIPLDDSDWPIGAIAIAIASIPFVVMMVRRVRCDGAPITTKLKSYSFAIFMGVFCGFLVGFTAVGFLNGYFDRSPPHLEPVKIVQLWHQTTEFVLRTYELEYHPYPVGNTEKKMVTVETMSSFHPDSLGVIDIGRGWLGMRWLRNFHPIVWNRVPQDWDKVIPGEITFQLPNEAQSTRIAPGVLLDDQSLVPPPDVLLPEVHSRMISYLTGTLKAKVITAAKP